VSRFKDVEDIQFALIGQDRWMDIVEAEFPEVSFANFSTERGDAHIIVISQNHGVEQIDLDGENYLHMDSLIGNAALSDNIEELDSHNLLLIDSINMPMVLITHKGETLKNVDQFSKVKDKNFVYASLSRDSPMYKILEKEFNLEPSYMYNEAQAFIIT
jgi:hypothetical protein